MIKEWIKENRELFRNDLDHHREGSEGSYARMELWLERAFTENNARIIKEYINV